MRIAIPLQEPIVERGVWWRPETPDDIVNGEVRISVEGAGELTIYGSPSPLRFRSIGGERPTIYGATTAGPVYSLLGCFDTSSVETGTGMSEVTIVPTVIVRGMHVPALEQVCIHTLQAHLSHLDMWLGRSGISVGQPQRGSFLEFDVEYREPPRHSTQIDEEVTLTFRRILSRQGLAPWASEVTIKQPAVVTIDSNVPQSLEHMLELLRLVQDLLSIATLHRVEPHHIAVINRDASSTDRRIDYADVFIETTHVDRRRPPRHPSDFLFCYPDVEPYWQAVVTSWFSQAEKLRPIRELYIASRHLERYLESRFLGSCQALEVYHRRFRIGNYLDPGEFKAELLPKLIDALPKSLDPSLRSSLSSRLEFMYEFSLRRRLQDLRSEFADIIKFHVSQPDRLCSDLVAFRNQFTHYSNETQRPDPLHVLYLTEGGLLLLEIALLAELGIPRPKIVELVSRCRSYRERVHWLGEELDRQTKLRALNHSIR